MHVTDVGVLAGGGSAHVAVGRIHKEDPYQLAVRIVGRTNIVDVRDGVVLEIGNHHIGSVEGGLNQLDYRASVGCVLLAGLKGGVSVVFELVQPPLALAGSGDLLKTDVVVVITGACIVHRGHEEAAVGQADRGQVLVVIIAVQGGEPVLGHVPAAAQGIVGKALAGIPVDPLDHHLVRAVVIGILNPGEPDIAGGSSARLR